MITKKALKDLRFVQLKPYKFNIRPMSDPTHKKAKFIQKIVQAYGRICLISLADGGIMVDDEPEMLEMALLTAQLTRSFFESPQVLPESGQERLDKVEELCEGLLIFKDQVIFRILKIEEEAKNEQNS